MNRIRTFLCLCLCASIHLTQAQYILTLDFSDMDPYVGLRSEIRVTDMSNLKEVGRRVILAIDSSAYSVDLYVLLQGHNYAVDFYTDVNDNGTYDPPPTDHAWRRTVMNASMNTTIAFTPDTIYTDIMLGDVFPYSNYDAIWGGHWRNLTFGSTDSIQASLKLTCDSIFASFKTSGVFGNPDTVQFNLADTIPADFDPVTDTIHYNVAPPWIGTITVSNGQVDGNISQSGTGLQFRGTVGETQILCLYTVFLGGNPLANGYFVVRERSVLSSSPEIVINGNVQDASCAGMGDGSIAAMVNGGMPGYAYAWSTGDTTQAISGLHAGEYTVTVTDTLGCFQTAAFTVGEPSEIVITVTTTDASCGNCDGTALVEASGGTPPYQSTGVFTGLCSGVYTATVTDDAGCTAMVNFTINESDPLTAEVTTTPESCPGTCDGSVTIVPTGGTPPYNTGISGMGFCAGSYTVFVTDANGCAVTVEFTIESVDSITLDTVLLVNAQNSLSNGILQVEATGGTPPYMYSLNGTSFQSSGLFENLAPGTYCITVQDAKGCQSMACYEIQNILGVSDLDHTLRIFPNPAHLVVLLESDVPVSIEMTDLLGQIVQSDPAARVHEMDLTGTPPGLYLLLVSDGENTVCKKLLVQ